MTPERKDQLIQLAVKQTKELLRAHGPDIGETTADANDDVVLCWSQIYGLKGASAAQDYLIMVCEQLSDMTNLYAQVKADEGDEVECN